MGERSPLSSADAAWLHMDRPTNLMVINSVLIFDEQLDWERLTEVIRRRLLDPYPRFRQRIVEGRLPPRSPTWVRDADFDLSRHLHRRGLAAPGDESSLKELIGDLASSPMDRDKPLWDMYLIDGPHPGCAVIVRMHHCIADGIALSGVMLSLTDSAHQDDIEPPLPARSGAASAALRLAVGLAREGLRTLAHPRHGIELADGLAADLRALAKLILTSADAPSVLKSDHGAAREVAWSRPLSLERIKAIARTQEATVNDVLLTAVSGALRGHLLAQGEEPHEIRALVPVNLRAPEDPARHELGNRFGLVYLSLPVELSSRRERLKELKRRMDEIKHSPEGAVSYALLETLGMTPPELESRLLDIFTNKATAVMTNVPGPRETVYLAGAPLRTVLVWAPTAGSVGTSVSIFSYSGAVTIGLLTHASLETEPQSILDRLEREVAAMDRLAPTTNGRHADPPPGQSR